MDHHSNSAANTATSNAQPPQPPLQPPQPCCTRTHTKVSIVANRRRPFLCYAVPYHGGSRNRHSHYNGHSRHSRLAGRRIDGDPFLK
jgi:hypothetical protein